LGKSQRTKGAVGEREVADIFSKALQRGPFKRNIGQARDGGNDINIGPLVVEVKRRKTLGTVYGWLQQAADAVRQRLNPGAHKPVVVARQDGGAWIVVIGLQDFLELTKSELQAHMPEGGPDDVSYRAFLASRTESPE
jgi:hypothetical protein